MSSVQTCLTDGKGMRVEAAGANLKRCPIFC